MPSLGITYRRYRRYKSVRMLQFLLPSGPLQVQFPAEAFPQPAPWLEIKVDVGDVGMSLLRTRHYYDNRIIINARISMNFADFHYAIICYYIHLYSNFESQMPLISAKDSAMNPKIDTATVRSRRWPEPLGSVEWFRHWMQSWKRQCHDFRSFSSWHLCSVVLLHTCTVN